MIDNDISFRFIKKEQIYECKQILFVYNICTEGFNLLNNEETSDLCLNTKFRGYRGTKIKILNEEMIRKVQ